MKSFQKIKLIISLLTIITVNLAAISAPLDFTAQEVKSTSITFTWTDKSTDEDGFRVCTKDRLGNNTDCSEALSPNTTSYTKEGISAYTRETYVVVVDKGGSTSLESDPIFVKTIHAWSGELLKCLKEALGITTPKYSPTKSELEGFTGDFNCASKGFETMDPVVDLKNIIILDLHDNDITGSIPTEIRQLVELKYLNLYNNNLSGEIPTEIGELRLLTYLSLGYNHLTGSIPTEIGELTQLTYLSLVYNQLTGSIPTEVGELTQLTYLSLAYNPLTGSIPTEIGKLTQLTSLYLFHNNLSGEIPTEIGELRLLKYIQLSDNQLTGSIPTEIGKLTQLISLYLHHNNLSGEIPTEIGELRLLRFLYLRDNNLSGKIPDPIINLTVMTIDQLSLENNCNLYNEDAGVQSYINIYQPEGWSFSGYTHILDTNSNDCFNTSAIVPTIMYLLN